MIGQKVNNFDIVRLLGEGGMGAVYEAVHPTIHRRVAIKVLRQELSADAGLVHRFINEARAANAIRHPNIIEIIDVGRLPNGLHYLVMELLQGESLAGRLSEDGCLDPSTAADLARQAASALEAAHANGIIHRDLKPDNLFLVADPRRAGHDLVKVLDFGIAKLRGDFTGAPVTQAGAIFGTPPYMSPEQCRGIPGGVDHRADIYALGIILYEMLCGAPPFVAAGLGEVMMLHMAAEPVPPSQKRPELPADLELVVLRALAKRPDARFASMAEFVFALEACALPVPSPRSRSPAGAGPPVLDRGALGELRTVAKPPAATLLGHTATPPPFVRSSRGPIVAGVLLASGLLAGLLYARLSKHGAAPTLSVASPQVAQGSTRAPEPPQPPAPSFASEPAPVPPPSQERAVKAHSSKAARDQIASTPSAKALVAPPVAAAAAESGFLSLDSAPWANVYLGGRLLGTTPLVRISLPAGKHVLTLKNPEAGASTSYMVEIKPGANASRFVGWEKP